MAEEEQGGPPAYPANAVHLARTAVLSQMQLSAMADQKASILMGAAFVIFTLAIGHSDGKAAPLPLLILGGAAFLSAVFAVLAILPAVRYRKRAPLNLMFFGSFTQLGEEEYIERLLAQLGSDDSIYRTMARDVYQNGNVLARKKYRMLGWAYRIFLAGLTASLAAFLIQSLA
ncbi:MAG TPA: Pycsar system effector family protein [Allosphingosinicella sp.]|nr:Pycsar system effector family protein [Allosphingosinicella sp.]